MNIGEALLALLNGNKVHRARYSPGLYLMVNPKSKAASRDPRRLSLCDIIVVGRLAESNSSGPWQASKADLEANDWSIYNG